MEKYCLLLCLLISLAAPVSSKDLGHLTVYGQAGYSDVLGAGSSTSLDEPSPLSADILYTYSNNRLSLLSEYFIYEGDHRLERLELGLALFSWSSLKLGLLHNPAEYWLGEFHRGQYAQTSITRPFQSLQGFSGGVTSRNLSGVQWLNEVVLPNDSTVFFDYTRGASPRLTAEESEVDIGDFFSGSNSYEMSVIRLRYAPWALNDSMFGLAYTKGEIEIDQAKVGSYLGPFFSQLLKGVTFNQASLNMFVNLEYEGWRLTASRLNERFRFEASTSPGVTAQFFTSGEGTDTFEFDLDYVHVEKTLKENVLVFARYEKIMMGEVTATMSFISQAIYFDIEYEKNIVGARWDFTSQQAVAVQYSDHDSFGQRQNMLHLTWSFFWGAEL